MWLWEWFLFLFTFFLVSEGERNTTFSFWGEFVLFIVYIGCSTISKLIYESWFKMIFSWLEFWCSLNLWLSYCKHPYPVVGSTLNGRLLFFMNRFTGSTFCHQSLSICFLENSDFLLSIAWASLSFSRLILCISCLLWTVAPGALPVAEAVEAIVLLCLFPGVTPRDIV